MDYRVPTFDFAGQFREGQQRGQNRAALRDFFAPAVGGDQNALAKLMQVNPQAAQNAQSMATSQRKSSQERIGQLAGVYAQTGDPGVWREMRQSLADSGFPADMPWEIASDEDRAGSVKFATAIAQQYGGATPQQELRPHVIGNALVDASGKVLYQGEDAQKWQLVNVPDGQGGAVQMEYSNGQWRQPSYGAQQAPQAITGGGAQVLDDAYAGAQVDPVADFGTLAQKYGAQVSSLARTPEHNARVGGVPNSRHLSGEGGDFVVPQPQRQQFMTDARGMGYDAIDEGDHVHLEPRRGVQASSRFAPGQGIAQGPRLGVTPGKEKFQARPLTPQEVAAARLPAGTVAYTTEGGVPNVVHKPDARSGAGDSGPKLSAGEAAKVRRDFKETKDALNMFRAFDQALKDIPSGPGLLVDGASKGRLGTAYNNARSSLRILYNTGVLQPGELPMLENALRDPTSFAAVVDPRTRPQIQAQLDELYRVIDLGIQNQVYSYPQIFNQQRFESARSAALAGGAGKYRVGQVIESGGKKYRVTDVSNPADPDVEEVR